MLVQETNLQLFGFTTLLEKEWYRLLTSVQGIGAKAAMAILGTLGPEATGRAIALGDWAAVKAAPGGRAKDRAARRQRVEGQGPDRDGHG